MTITMFDPLTDPSLRASYRKPRSARELCDEAHYHHMQRVRQDQWLKDLYARADQRRAEDEARLEKELPELVAAAAKPKRTRARTRKSSS